MPNKNLPDLILPFIFLNNEMTLSIALPTATGEQNRFCTNYKNPYFYIAFSFSQKFKNAPQSVFYPYCNTNYFPVQQAYSRFCWNYSRYIQMIVQSLNIPLTKFIYIYVPYAPVPAQH